MKNLIKATAVAKDVPLCKVAERLGMQRSNFSVLIRRYDLPQEKKDQIMRIIDEIALELYGENEESCVAERKNK